MEIRQLELFLAVIDTGSVTRAAERVYLSPGAVTAPLSGAPGRAVSWVGEDTPGGSGNRRGKGIAAGRRAFWF